MFWFCSVSLGRETVFRMAGSTKQVNSSAFSCSQVTGLLCTALHLGRTSSIRRDKTPKKKYLIVNKEEDIEHVKNNPVTANKKRAACITFNISRKMGQSAQVETYLQGDSETVSHRRI